MLPAQQQPAQRLLVLKHRRLERQVQREQLARAREPRPERVLEQEPLLSYRRQRGQRQQ